MDLSNIKYSEVIHDKLKKCEFCGKTLTPIGFDFLYANISSDDIKYGRCSCKKAQEYWKEKDEQEYELHKREQFKEMINAIYRQNNMKTILKNMNFENFNIDSKNETALKIVKDYTNKCITRKQSKGLIITGESGVGKTHLAASISNKLIKNDKIVLMAKLSMLLGIIKESFKDKTKSESELIELYSNVDMIIIDNLGIEKISNWVLEKLYTIIENRNENRLPIIITTRFDKHGLIERFSQSGDEQLVDATISKLYQMCYGITLKKS